MFAVLRFLSYIHHVPYYLNYNGRDLFHNLDKVSYLILCSDRHSVEYVKMQCQMHPLSIGQV